MMKSLDESEPVVMWSGDRLSCYRMDEGEAEYCRFNYESIMDQQMKDSN